MRSGSSGKGKAGTSSKAEVNVILKNENEEVVFTEKDGKLQPLSVNEILENVLITGKDSENSVLGVLVQESMDDVKRQIKSNIRS
jgi:hypothetical protein